MRVRDRREHVQKQADATFDSQGSGVAELVEWLALHILDDQVGLAIRHRTRIDEARDVGVRQPRQHASLTTKSIESVRRVRGQVEELDRERAFEVAVAALRQPHFAHATAAEQGLDGVGAHPLADSRRAAGRQAERPVEEIGGLPLALLSQHIPQRLHDIRMFERELCEPTLQVLDGDVLRLLQERIYTGPGFPIRSHRRQPREAAFWTRRRARSSNSA